MSTLGDRVRELRMSKGFTQTDLGEGYVTASMISQIESNKANPSFKVLQKIAEKLETTMEHLLAGSFSNLEAFTTYKMARCCVAGRDYQLASEMYVRLLHLNFTVSKTQLMVEYAECLIALSLPEEAIEGLLQTLDSVTDVDRSNHVLISNLFYRLGLAYMSVRNYLSAHESLQSALLEYSLEDKQDPIYKATLYHCLAQTIRYVNQREYERCLNLAIEHYKSVNADELGKVYLSLAQNSTDQLEYSAALTYTDKAISAFLHKGLIDEFKDCERLVVILKHQQRSDDYQQTIERLLKIVDHYKGREAEKRAELFLDIAALHHSANDKQDANSWTYATKAKDLLTADHPLTGKVYVQYGLICLDRHEAEEAKRHFYTAIDILKRNDLLRELHDTVDTLLDLLEQEENYKEGLDVCRSFTTFLIERLQWGRGVVL